MRTPTFKSGAMAVTVAPNASPEMVALVRQINNSLLQVDKKFQNLTDGFYSKNNPYSSLGENNQKFIWITVTAALPTSDSWMISIEGHDITFVGAWPLFSHAGNLGIANSGGMVVPATAGTYTIYATNIEAVGGNNALITAYQDGDVSLPLIAATLTNTTLGTVYTYNFTVT